MIIPLQHSYVDQSPLVARRLGFASLPLAALFILIGSQSVWLIFSSHYAASSPWTWSTSIRSLSNDDILRYITLAVMGFLFWLWFVLQNHSSASKTLIRLLKSFVVVKIIIGVNLLGYAHRRRADMESRKAADVVNDFGRDPIGEGREEQVCFH